MPGFLLLQGPRHMFYRIQYTSMVYVYGILVKYISMVSFFTPDHSQSLQSTIDPWKRQDFQACESCQYNFLCHLATCAADSCIPYQWGIHADVSSALASFSQQLAAALVTHALCSIHRIDSLFLSAHLLPPRIFPSLSTQWPNRSEHTWPCTAAASFAH